MRFPERQDYTSDESWQEALASWFDSQKPRQSMFDSFCDEGGHFDAERFADYADDLLDRVRDK